MQATQLRAQRDDLQDALLNAPAIPTPTNLEILRKYIAETVRIGDPAQVKQLINSLVAKVVVTDRDEIQPYFYLPAEAPGQALGEKVRPLYGSVRPGGSHTDGNGTIPTNIGGQLVIQGAFQVR